MNETDKLIAEQLKTLPPNLQQAINTVPWKSLVQEIGKANLLYAEQVVSLEQETMFIIYGFENPNDYVSNIVREVGISEDAAYIIAESIVNKIFDPILKKSEENEKVAAISASVPEIPPANLPMVEEGEVAHTVPHVEQITQSARQDLADSKVSLPDYRYAEGKDPYREPLG